MHAEAGATHPQAVVLLSGGLDSAVTLAIAQHEGFLCRGLSFDYGQRHRFELQAAERLASAAGVDHLALPLDLRAIGGSALTSDQDVPKAAQPSPEGEIPSTYVPARNLIFLSFATAYAETLSAGAIFIGANAIDYSGYPDCRPEFLDAFARAATLGTKAGVEGSPVRVLAPLLHLSKSAIIRRGVDLGVDFSLTHSCYDPDDAGRACGACDACLLRKRGFAEAGVNDPTRYASDR